MRTCMRVCEWGTRAHTGAKVATQPYVDSVVGLSGLFVDLSVCLFIYTGGGIFALSQRKTPKLPVRDRKFNWFDFQIEREEEASGTRRSFMPASPS